MARLNENDLRNATQFFGASPYCHCPIYVVPSVSFCHQAGLIWGVQDGDSSRRRARQLPELGGKNALCSKNATAPTKVRGKRRRHPDGYFVQMGERSPSTTNPCTNRVIPYRQVIRCRHQAFTELGIFKIYERTTSNALRYCQIAKPAWRCTTFLPIIYSILLRHCRTCVKVPRAGVKTKK